MKIFITKILFHNYNNASLHILLVNLSLTILTTFIRMKNIIFILYSQNHAGIIDLSGKLHCTKNKMSCLCQHVGIFFNDFL